MHAGEDSMSSFRRSCRNCSPGEPSKNAEGPVPHKCPGVTVPCGSLQSKHCSKQDNRLDRQIGQGAPQHVPPEHGRLPCRLRDCSCRSTPCTPSGAKLSGGGLPGLCSALPTGPTRCLCVSEFVQVGSGEDMSE